MVSRRTSYASPLLFALFLCGFATGGCEHLSSNLHRESKERTGLFSTIQGVAINLVYKTLRVIDDFECVFACLGEPSCQSVNFNTAGNPKHLCELSQNTIESSPSHKQERPGYRYLFPIQACAYRDACNSTACRNGGTCEHACNQRGYRCHCAAYNKGEDCELWTVDVSSCKDIFTKTSYRKDMAYSFVISGQQTHIYCHLSSDLCATRGWTLAVKIDGSKQTLAYASTLWANKNAHNLTAGQTGLDNHETKMPSYWGVSFQSLCVGLKVGANLKWAHIPHTAASLYDVMADGTYRRSSIGRVAWLSLIGGSSLQPNCNAEGFNNGHARIGIKTNQENDCNSPDSALGFGMNWGHVSCGNVCKLSCSHGDRDTVAFGYIFIK